MSARDALQLRGVGWAARVVSLGAVAGTVTSTMTGLLSQARLFVVLGRERLLPGWLAEVSTLTGAPVHAASEFRMRDGAFALFIFRR